MNREDKIKQGLQEHYQEALQYFSEDKIVGVFLQGSQNYELDNEYSDIDTKLIVVPSFKDICLNRKPISTTHVRENEEHIDWKDIRLYMETFRKQNLNFLEILFTKYYIVNPIYEKEWKRLVERREEIARMNAVRAVKSMVGIAHEKFHAMEHRYPSKIEIIDKYGYDGKQVSHLIRVAEYLTRYIRGEDYEKCLIPKSRKMILDYKALDRYSLEAAREDAKKAINYIDAISAQFYSLHKEEENQEIRELLEDVSYNIMKIAVQKELEV